MTRGDAYCLLLDKYDHIIRRVRPTGESWESDRDACVKEMQTYMRWNGSDLLWVNMTPVDQHRIASHMMDLYQRSIK